MTPAGDTPQGLRPPRKRETAPGGGERGAASAASGATPASDTQLPRKIPPTNVEKAVPRRGGWQAPTSPARAPEQEPERKREPGPFAPQGKDASAAAQARAQTSQRPSAASAGGRAGAPTGRRGRGPLGLGRRIAGRAAGAGRGGFRVPGVRRSPGVISRGERVLFWSLLATVLAMTIFLVRYRERVDAHFESRAMAVPLASAGSAVTTGQLTLYLASDMTGSLMERSLDYPLPDDPNMRAQIVLEKLLAEYAAPGSPHPLQPLAPGVAGVDEVFLMPVPGHAREQSELAVVDLTPNFVHTHPSGMEPEMLTLLSMIATLHATMPRVAQVRFLVDGQTRQTLAGHADLAQTYLAGAAQMTPQEAFSRVGVRP